MAFNSLLNFFRLDEADDEYDDGYEEETVSEVRHEPRRRPAEATRDSEPDNDESSRRTSFLNSKPKVVPMKPAMQVNIIQPNSFDDAQGICNKLISGRPVVVNLEGFDQEIGQRIMDFISGCVYAINGNTNQISRFIYIFTPENIDINSDSVQVEQNTVSMMPTIDKDF